MSVKFKVFKGKDGQHFAHMRAGNGRITWQTEGYTRSSGAFKVCASTWKAIGGSGAVPFTRDSLLPRLLS
jgi:uncharacterized protein YegP (UPF0339 family)